MFYFKYIVENLKDAQEHGFSLLILFPQINATYEYPWLFALFLQDYQIQAGRKLKRF